MPEVVYRLTFRDTDPEYVPDPSTVEEVIAAELDFDGIVIVENITPDENPQSSAPVGT